MRYQTRPQKRHWPRRIFAVLAVLAILGISATVLARHFYIDNLRPVGNSQEVKEITIVAGSSVDDIANRLKAAGLIRSTWAFKLYVSSSEARDKLQAGTYRFESIQSVQEIVAQLTHGVVATDLITILPGQRLDQIRTALLNNGYSKAAVDAALDPSNYNGNSALVDKPAGASLEGYLYPDSFQKTATTDLQLIVGESLNEMNKRLTPDLRAAFARQGLSTYQGIILASIVEQEVSRPADRLQVAQVFLKRLQSGMKLGSDVTAFYGSIAAGQQASLTYDSPYNTLQRTGLPPTPISNVSENSLQAVAHPATTDWLYFVTGDDGVTHFSRTFEEHQALTAQYCHKLCSL